MYIKLRNKIYIVFLNNKSQLKIIFIFNTDWNKIRVISKTSYYNVQLELVLLRIKTILKN